MNLIRTPPRFTSGRMFGGVCLVDRPAPLNVQRLDAGCIPLIQQMQVNGIRVDVPYLHALDNKLATIQDDLMWTIRAELDSPDLNVGSPDQIAHVLFETLKIHGDDELPMVPSGKRASTDDEVLSRFKDRHPAVPLILDHREVSKARNTYTSVIPKLVVAADGRLRTVFKTTRTDTGRLSSGDKKRGLLNLQNIPIRAERWIDGFGKLGAAIRNAYIADDGCVLVSNDEGQIEMRVAAHVSGDEAMADIFRLGKDIHTFTAIAMFRLDEARILHLAKLDKAKTISGKDEEDWKHFKHRYRLPAKNLGFGILYGQTGKGLQQRILAEGGPFWEVEECDRFIDKWFAVYTGIHEWVQETHRRAKQFGMVWDMFGRVRRIPEAQSTQANVVSAALRQAGNMPVQGGAQGILKLVMAIVKPIVEYFQSFPGVVCRPLLQIHDELLAECSKDIAQEYAAMVKEVMETCVRLLVPLESSSDIAARWGDLK